MRQHIAAKVDTEGLLDFHLVPEEILLCNLSHEGKVQVCVRINASRHNILSSGIDCCHVLQIVLWEKEATDRSFACWNSEGGNNQKPFKHSATAGLSVRQQTSMTACVRRCFTRAISLHAKSFRHACVYLQLCFRSYSFDDPILDIDVCFLLTLRVHNGPALHCQSRFTTTHRSSRGGF